VIRQLISVALTAALVACDATPAPGHTTDSASSAVDAGTRGDGAIDASLADVGGSDRGALDAVVVDRGAPEVGLGDLLGLDAEAPGDGAQGVDGGSAADVGGGEDAAVAITVELQLADNPNSVLSALATVSCSTAAQVQLHYWRDGAAPQQTGLTRVGLQHEIPLVGMRPETRYWVEALALREGLEIGRSAAGHYTTGALPGNLPQFSVTVHRQELVQPGVTLFAPFRRGTDPAGNDVPSYIAVDSEGVVVWYYQVPTTSSWNTYLRLLPSGELLLSIPDGFRFITIAGETTAEITAAAAGLQGFHHDGIVLPSGNLVTLGAESRQVDVPGLGGQVTMRADVIYELNPAGQIVWSWAAFDHFDPTRCPASCSRIQPVSQTHNLTHGNALLYVEADDSLLFNARNQSWLVKISRVNGEVLWRLGPEGDFALVNEDTASGRGWFYSSHAPELQPDGDILVYDNGNDRPPLIAPRFSRGARFRVDEAAMEAEQAWQHQVPSYTPTFGDADQLPNGNVLLCAGGPEAGAQARILEVTGDEPAELVWELSVPNRSIYRAEREPSLYR